MRERLLLTGARGFVGRALVAPLVTQGFELHAVTRGAVPASDGVHWHQADLLDTSESCALLRGIRPAVLLHAAWYVEHGRFWTAPENTDWVEASEVLARNFAESGGRRFIGIGTGAEYATTDTADAAPWPETRRLAPETPYGIAKADLAARLARLAERRGLSVAWARLFHLFGEGEHPDRLVPSVARALLAGREARCASGLPVRDFASTRHIGRALAALAASDVTGAVNVASGEGRRIADLVRELGVLAGRPDLIRLGALPDRPGEVPVMVADTTRLRREVGFAEAASLTADLQAMLNKMRGDGGRGRD